jgi:hypothetical protein
MLRAFSQSATHIRKKTCRLTILHKWSAYIKYDPENRKIFEAKVLICLKILT